MQSVHPASGREGAHGKEVLEDMNAVRNKGTVSVQYCLDMHRKKGKAAVIAAGQVIGFVPEEGAGRERRK